jgi:hypothetical protein
MRGFLIPPELFEKLKEYAKQQKVTVNKALVMILTQFFNQHVSQTANIKKENKEDVIQSVSHTVSHTSPDASVPQARVEKEVDPVIKYKTAMKLWDARSLIDSYNKAGNDEALKKAVVELLKEKMEDPRLGRDERTLIDLFLRGIGEEVGS